MAASGKQKSKKRPLPQKLKPCRKRVWVFRIIALVVIPVLFFGILEILLRVCGVGYPTGIAIPCQMEGQAVYCHNVKFGWRYFPPNISRQFDGFVFDAEKPTGTYRIFVLGASAAMGMPASEYNFGRILEVMLNEAYPGTDFEVITVAMPAINSHAVVLAAQDCAGYEPDLFLVYLGNNEVVGPFGPGTVFAPLSPSLFAIRMNIALKETRLGQLMDRFSQAMAPRAKIPKRWGGLEMFLDKQVRYDSPALETAYRHFQRNVSDICRIGRKSGARVIVSSVGCNLKDCPPFASQHRIDLTMAEKQQWDTVYQKGIGQEEAGQYQPAIEFYRAAAQIDETFADLQFRTGRCFRKIGETENARPHFQKAMQYDTLRLRADARINEILRAVSEGKDKEGIYFVDSVSALEENIPGRIPGEELFYEHVHFNFSGHYVVARAIFRQMREILPAGAQGNPPDPLTQPQCAQRLAYTGFEQCLLWEPMINEMLDHPPFTNQLYHEEFMETIRGRLEALRIYTQPEKLKEVVRLHEEAIERKPDDWQFHWRYSIVLRKGMKDNQAEEIQLRKTLSLCPCNTSAYLALGRNLQRQGRYREASEALGELLKLNPASAQAHVELAKIFRDRRDNENYIRHLEKSISLAPAVSIDPYQVLAEVYYTTGQPHKSMRVLQDALKIFPEAETAQVHVYLGFLWNAQGNYEKAFEEMKLALNIEPKCANDELFRKHFTELEKKIKAK